MTALAPIAPALTINLNYAIWYHIIRNGGDAVQDWRNRGATRTIELAYWLPGRFDGAEALPTLAIPVLRTGEDAEELRTQCRAWATEGTVCWLVDPSRQLAWTIDGSRESQPEAMLSSPAVPRFQLRCADLFTEITNR